jgi:uncharacterized protein YbdZ (MbtH family)
MRNMIEKNFPIRIRKRNFLKEKHYREVEEENKRRGYLVDIPSLYIQDHSQPNVNHVAAFPERFLVFVNLVIQRKKQFLVFRNHADKFGILCSITPIEDGWTAEFSFNVAIQEFYTSHTQQAIYSEAKEQIWFAKGLIIKPEQSTSEEEKVEDDPKREKYEELDRLSVTNLEFSQSENSRQVLNWVNKRYRALDPESRENG